MEEFGREPCPMRILEDLGGAFAMGLIGGGIFQGIKGFRNAPTGFNRRFNVSSFKKLYKIHENIKIKCKIHNLCKNLLITIYLKIIFIFCNKKQQYF